MHLSFTLVIKCENGYQEVYQLSYQPIPIWIYCGECVINMKESGNFYALGSFQKLIEYHKNHSNKLIHSDNKCVLICDQNLIENAGYDDDTTVDRIIKDIESEGFQVTVLKQ